MRVTASVAMAVAERGASRKSPSSPSKLPLPTVLSRRCSPAMSFLISTLPMCTMNASPFGSSPSLKITSPGLKVRVGMSPIWRLMRCPFRVESPVETCDAPHNTAVCLTRVASAAARPDSHVERCPPRSRPAPHLLAGGPPARQARGGRGAGRGVRRGDARLRRRADEGDAARLPRDGHRLVRGRRRLGHHQRPRGTAGARDTSLAREPAGPAGGGHSVLAQGPGARAHRARARSRRPTTRSSASSSTRCFRRPRSTSRRRSS